MLIDENLFYFDGVKLSQFSVKKIIFGYSKLWGNDTGRDNLAGSFSGTYIGLFLKLTITFGRQTQDQLEKLISLLNKSEANIKFYNPIQKKWIEKTFTVGDYSLTYDNIKKCDAFDISLTCEDRL